MERNAVVWTDPPTRWSDAPYAGNGSMGVYAYYDEESDELVFPVTRMDAYDRRQIGSVSAKDPGVTARGRLPNGRFRLKLPETIQFHETRLDLWDGEYRFEFSVEDRSGHVRAFIHPERDVLVVEISGLPTWTDGTWSWHPDRAHSLRLGENRSIETPPYPPQYQKRRRGVPVSIQELPEDEAYGTQGEGNAQNATAWKVIGEGDARTVLISQAFSRPGRTTADTAIAEVLQAANVGPRRLREEARSWWHDFMSKSFLSLPDPRAEQYFWLQVYRMGATVREEGPMVDLSGPAFPWNHRHWKDDIPAVRWPGIWWNWNQQGAYTPFHKSNHPRLGFSMVNGLWKHRENLARNARAEDASPPRYTIGDRGGLDLLSAGRSIRNNANLA